MSSRPAKSPDQKVSKERLFLAIWPSPSVRRAITESVSKSVSPRARWVPAENLHITLVFLGPVGAIQKASVIEVAERLEVGAFNIQLRQYEYWRRARLLCLCPDETPIALQNLHHSLTESLVAAGFSAEKRNFTPHVTLARKGDPVPKGRLAQPLNWPADRLSLIASDTSGPVSRYREIWHRTLAWE